MNDELNKTKNIDLKNKILNIRTELIKLNEEYKNIYNNLRMDIIIDKKTISEDNLKKINNNNIAIINELNDLVIPTINNSL